jgi:signal transduction histidine kinase
MAVDELLSGVRAMIEPLATQKGVRLEMVCAQGSAAVADFELLHRMLLNLGLNALRETPRDGVVSIRALVAGCDILFSVEDTGSGIPDETLTRIFDPMFSTHREGCGLGLSIVQRIVESHNGSIEVTSSAEGTLFNIRIPVNSANTEVASGTITCSR